MNSVFTFRRSDEFVPNLQISEGTALDCSANGGFLVLADYNDYIRVNIENGTPERKRRSNHKIIKMIKCHPLKPHIFVGINGSNVEFWQNFTNIASISKTARISDFSFDPFNEDRSVVASAESVIFVDSRTREQDRLPLLFGANQAKFSQAGEHLLFTAHISDVRCFDVRNMRAPCRQYISSGHERQIHTMELHPADSNVLITSSATEAKLWNFSTDNIQPHILDYSNVRKFGFSQNGDVFAGLSYSSAGKLETSVKLWQITSLGNAQELRHNVTDFIDICWQRNTSQNQYLFTLSRQNNLFRHLVVPNIQTESTTMRAPTKQTAEDEALDQLILIGPNKTKPTAQSIPPSAPKPKSSNPLEKTDFRSTFFMDSNSKSWNCWLRTPSIPAEDLLFELNSVRKLTVLGLACNEINFQRAAIGLSYSHYGIYKKLVIEIRFHRNFIENGLVFFELIKKDSPLSLQTAKLLLSQLSEEAAGQQKKESTMSVLARTLRQLQSIVDTIHIFPPVNAEILEQGRLSIVHDESECSKLSERFLSIDKESQSSAAFTTSPYDSFTPGPRLSGARFNQNGILCLFGQIECIFRLVPNSRDEKVKSMEDRSTKSTHVSRLLSSRNVKSAARVSSPQEDLQQLAFKRPSRSLFNRHEPTQQSFMRTLSDYQSYATQYMAERGSQEYPETNHSFTMYYNPSEPRPETESDNRRRLSSVTLEESTSMSASMINKSSKSTILSPIRRRRGISMTSCVTADSQSGDIQPTNSIIVLDTTVFQNVSRTLGQHYRLMGGSNSQVCYHNMWIVTKYAPYKRELIALWQILYEFFNSEEERQLNGLLQSNKKSRRKEMQNIDSINIHPIDRRFIFYFIEYYYSKFDIQTAAMLSCILMRSIDTLIEQKQHRTEKTKQQKTPVKKLAAFDKFFPLFAAKETDRLEEQVLLHHKINKSSMKKSQTELNYSDHSNYNSNGTSFEHRENFFPTEKPNLSDQTKDSEASNSNLQLEKRYDPCLTLAKELQEENFGLSSTLQEHLEQLCLEYGVMLWQWGFLNQRAELFKCIRSNSLDVGLKQVTHCTRCNSTDGSCSKCQPVPIICMVCDERCNGGLVTVCKVCSHGGHFEHVAEYFGVFDSCPCCGCRCRN